MDHPLIDLITEKIRQAEAEGAFDNLPGAGKPLPRVDDPENAVLNRIMQEHGAAPAFVPMQKELARLRLELSETSDRDARRAIMEKMADLDTRIALSVQEWRRR